jgi:hypothetical protein
MKIVISACLLLSCTISTCQIRWVKAGQWTLYAFEGNDQFKVSMDSLYNLDTLTLNQDSMAYYLFSAEIKHPSAPLIWMGGYIATCQLNGVVRKIEISNYGGFFFDEKTKAYYHIASDKAESWNAYLQQSFLTLAWKVGSKHPRQKMN